MKKARLFVVLAAVGWGFIPVFYHIMRAAGLDNIQTIFLRFAFAAAGYVVYLLVRDRSLLRIKRPAHLWYFVGTGVCSLALFNLCYITCIGYAGVAVAALLLYTAPAFVLVMSALLFREKLTGRGMAALGMTALGCALVSGMCAGAPRVSAAALLWGLGSGFGYALYSIFGKFALRHYRAETITAYTAVFAALATLPLARPAQLAERIAQPQVLAGACGSALVCTVLAYLLYTAGLSRVPAGQASILSTVEPVVASLLGVLVLGEIMTWDKIAGIVLVLGAVAVLGLPQKRAIAAPEPHALPPSMPTSKK